LRAELVRCDCYLLPLVAACLTPSPADDLCEQPLDLGQVCEKNWTGIIPLALKTETWINYKYMLKEISYITQFMLDICVIKPNKKKHGKLKF